MDSLSLLGLRHESSALGHQGSWFSGLQTHTKDFNFQLPKHRPSDMH